MTVGTRVRGWLVSLFVALGIVLCYPAATLAQSQSAQAAQTEELQKKMQAMQQQMEELSKQLQALKQQQQQQTQDVQKATVAANKASDTVVKTQSSFDKFMKGFFGTLDTSIDYTTKGMGGLNAYQWSYASGAPGSPFVQGAQKAGPYGKVGWLGAMSSNGANIGYRGSHAIPNIGVDFIYQVSTAFNLVAAPGLQNTWTKQSNTVQGAIGLGDTFLGFQKKDWGRIRFGELYMPYKTATDRLNPFSGQLGDYSVVMGNTGGDNRVEFGTRMDHVVDYKSPDIHGFSFDLGYAFGQQIDPYNNLTPLGSSDCSGSNVPGSGNLPLNCDDGGFDDAYSADLKFESHGLYLVAAYEMHKRVNRSSDGDGANNPLYDYWFSQGANGPNAQYLDWADYQAYAAEYPQAAAAGSAEYAAAYDTADEWAMKFGGQYAFDFGLTISYLYEDMHRTLPQVMEFQNERQRTGDWLALEQDFNGGADRIAIGWAHASATVGDPGGQHNFNPNGIGGNQANMYTIAWWHKLDKQLTVYFDAAETINDGNAHYDIGAGGHGIKTDCHDATHAQFIDYSSAGPTTWGGCHPLGISTGVNYRF
jgi:predicted porin/cell division protein FtsB